MPLKLSMSSTSTGRLFTSTNDAIEARTIPTISLPESHPFSRFWNAHIAALATTGPYDPVVDALVAIALNNPSWREKASTKTIVARRREMRTLLSDHPPDVVVVSGAAGVYGYHLREEFFWRFIFISQEYIDLWKDAEMQSEEQLGLTVLLGAAIDHELGHWIFTLKAGLFSPQFIAAAGTLDIDLQNEAVAQLSDREQQANRKKHTQKKLRTAWKADIGEAGDYVEFRSRGGILTYSRTGGKTFLSTGPRVEDNHGLPMAYLRTFLEDRPPSLRFASVPNHHTSRMKKSAFFPHNTDDSCPQSSSSLVPRRLGTCEHRVQTAMLLDRIIKERKLK